MLRRLTSSALQASAKGQARRTIVSLPSSARANPGSSTSNSSNSNKLFEFDAKTVANEMRKRGLTGVANRETGMDRDTIVRLLYSLGSRHEVERYLRIFTSSSSAAAGTKTGVLPEAKFAVIK